MLDSNRGVRGLTFTFTFMGLVWLCSMHNPQSLCYENPGREGGRSYPGSLYHSDRRTWGRAPRP